MSRRCHRRRIVMTEFTLFTVVVGACVALLLARAARAPRYCPPSDHLVTVVGRHRLRDGLGKRYWIRCRVCDLEHGPYDDWQAAWRDALQAQIAMRRRRASAEPSPSSATRRVTR
jgi:hypothetical protein